MYENGLTESVAAAVSCLLLLEEPVWGCVMSNQIQNVYNDDDVFNYKQTNVRATFDIIHTEEQTDLQTMNAFDLLL